MKDLGLSTSRDSDPEVLGYAAPLVALTCKIVGGLSQAV